MGILGSILGKRDNGMPYRTTDGGHPAPYPDMTDEQLYNYETAFDVPHRTFDRPPSPAARQAEPAVRGGRLEPSLEVDGAAYEPVLPAAYEQQAWADQKARQVHEDNVHEDRQVHEDHPAHEEREAADRLFDAPRYTARATGEQGASATAPRAVPDTAMPSRPPAPPLDFSRPVRLITTRQPVEIITTRARHPVYKVQGYIGDDDVVTVFTSDGRLSETGLPYLENVPEMERLYLNIYLSRDGVGTDRFVVTQHPTRDAADAEAGAGAQQGRGERIKCIEVELGI